MNTLFEQQLIEIVNKQTNLIMVMNNQMNYMENQLNHIKKEVDTVHWNITHVFGIVNEVKKLIMDKMDLS